MDRDDTQQKQLREVLLNAFPAREDLEMMVSDQLKENLSVIAGESTLEYTVFKLVQWAMATGNLERLVIAALKQNSQNSQLISIAKQLGLSNDQYFANSFDTLANSATTRKTSCFLAGVAPLRDQKEFYGRVREVYKLLDNTRKGGCTSIIGPRRIGKTWLMNYLQCVAPRECGPHFRIGHLDATAPDCTTIANFTVAALEALGISVSKESRAALDLAVLQYHVKELLKKQQRPVLCIDEFEGFGDHQVFDRNFFSELRSLTNRGLLCLITASKTPLIDIVDEITKSSPFFNVFQTLELKPFDKYDAEQFIKDKGAQARFSEQELGYLRKYGSEYDRQEQYWPPLLLQLAGEALENDKHSRYYRPDDGDYWLDFQKRLLNNYRGMVK